jgi:GTP-binding protein HflX
VVDHQEPSPGSQRAFLVGLTSADRSPADTEALLEELSGLVASLGFTVGGWEILPLTRPQPRFLVGPGQAQRIAETAREAGCQAIVFDGELSPSQQRNWERFAPGLAVVDRQEIILDIFAERASTSEARLQIELARAEYSLPRLRRAWTHLSRQRGAGTQRGEGETQLEVDQRMVRKRIQRLRLELEAVRRKRDVQRRKRQRVPVPTGALVGYTNAGKSSLLNALTEAEVFAADQLFATLDPTSRRVHLSNGRNLVLSDTVGFVRNLPHRLVDAFKATLEEAVLSDFLVHVIDWGSPEREAHRETTEEVLAELGADAKPTLLVFNKIDRAEDPAELARWRARFPEAHFVSARTGEGMEGLRDALREKAEPGLRSMQLLIPHDRHDLVHYLHEIGAVDRASHEDRGVLIRGRVPERQVSRLSGFALAGS